MTCFVCLSFDHASKDTNYNFKGFILFLLILSLSFLCYVNSTSAPYFVCFSSHNCLCFATYECCHPCFFICIWLFDRWNSKGTGQYYLWDKSQQTRDILRQSGLATKVFRFSKYEKTCVCSSKHKKKNEFRSIVLSLYPDHPTVVNTNVNAT